MTRPQLQQLLNLLDDFKDWIDGQDANFILSCSSDNLASRVMGQHIENMKAIDEVRHHVECKLRGML